MENASKALIIAGAILLSISIIGIGMFVFQQASGAMQNIGMDAEKVAAFNQPFDGYEGDHVRGANVIQLINLVRNHNAAHQDDATLNIKIEKNSGTPDGTIQESVVLPATTNGEKSNVSNGKMYKVQFGYAPDGHITQIYFSEASS